TPSNNFAKWSKTTTRSRPACRSMSTRPTPMNRPAWSTMTRTTTAEPRRLRASPDTIAETPDRGARVTSPPHVPARGVRMRRSERRAQPLRAAREVFADKGYHAAAMDDSAERAGGSKPVLYQHFPGKRELYLALLDESGEQMLARIHEALLSTDDNKQRVTATVAAYFDFVGDPATAHRLLFESDLGNEPAVRDRLDRFTALCAQEIAKVIAEDTGLPVEESTL